MTATRKRRRAQTQIGTTRRRRRRRRRRHRSLVCARRLVGRLSLQSRRRPKCRCAPAAADLRARSLTARCRLAVCVLDARQIQLRGRRLVADELHKTGRVARNEANAVARNCEGGRTDERLKRAGCRRAAASTRRLNPHATSVGRPQRVARPADRPPSTRCLIGRRSTRIMSATAVVLVVATFRPHHEPPRRRRLVVAMAASAPPSSPPVVAAARRCRRPSSPPLVARCRSLCRASRQPYGRASLTRDEMRERGVTQRWRARRLLGDKLTTTKRLAARP